MQIKRIKLRFRRRIRKGQRQVEDFSSAAEENIDKLIFKRFGRLNKVRRFILSWVLLMVIIISGLVIQNIKLSGYYQTIKSVPGGIYKEGVLGAFTNANPIYATSNADTSVSKLVFSGLFTFDSKGNLIGDLAKSYTVDDKGITYTVTLKDNLKWQDSQPLTSKDVLYTYKSIQNPDAQSPLQSSWRDIDITAPNPKTIVFSLASPLASFKYSMTNGILPEHILGNVPAYDLRSVDFNTVHPIGSGPFSFKALQIEGEKKENAKEQIALLPFNDYALGKPNLDEFIINVFASEEQLIDNFKSKQLDAIYGLNYVPKSIQNTKNVEVYSIPLKAASMVFFKTTSPGPLSNQKVRNALVQSADTKDIIASLGYPARAVRSPFLSGQVGYDKALLQPGFNLNNAKSILESDGWKIGKNNIRYKDNKPLAFSLSIADTPESKTVAKKLRAQWKAAGADVQIRSESPTDFQTTVAYHSYDAILYGITVGPDPDVFVYWDSSQADIRSSSRLNLSEYKNPAADTSLESGRTRIAPEVRAFKYKSFLQAWQQDSPALALYQPRLLYITNGHLSGLSTSSVSSPAERYNNVRDWQIRQAKVTN
jgi:peptide/nickel transport system substrate-binding protein